MSNDRKLNKEKTDSKKKRVGENVYIGKYEHVFHKPWKDDEIKALADEMLEWFEDTNSNKPKNIWLKDFLIKKRIRRQRLSEFVQRNEYFAAVYEICQMIQESYLVKLGMSKAVASSMPIFALKNISRWQDNPDRDEEESKQKVVRVEYV